MFYIHLETLASCLYGDMAQIGDICGRITGLKYGLPVSGRARGPLQLLRRILRFARKALGALYQLDARAKGQCEAALGAFRVLGLGRHVQHVDPEQ